MDGKSVVVLMNGILPPPGFGLDEVTRSKLEQADHASRYPRGIEVFASAEDEEFRTDEFLPIIPQFGIRLNSARVVHNIMERHLQGRKVVDRKRSVLELNFGSGAAFLPSFSKDKTTRSADLLKAAWERWVEKQFARSWNYTRIYEKPDVLLIDLGAPQSLNLGNRVVPVYAHLERMVRAAVA